MAKLYVAEFEKQGRDGAGFIAPVAKAPALVEQVVTIGATSEQSAAFGSLTRLVRVHTDAICSIAFGSDPTATANTSRMAAGQTEYFIVSPGDKVAVIENT